jgi:hypothetical protein
MLSATPRIDRAVPSFAATFHNIIQEKRVRKPRSCASAMHHIIESFLSPSRYRLPCMNIWYRKLLFERKAVEVKSQDRPAAKTCMMRKKATLSLD